MKAAFVISGLKAGDGFSSRHLFAHQSILHDSGRSLTAPLSADEASSE